MSYENDDDSIWQEDSAEEQARLGFVVRLLEENETRYRQQSKVLLRNGEFWHAYGETVLVYSLENRGCALRTSMNGFDFHLSSWIQLSGKKVDKYRTLELQFARSEAQWESR